MTFVAAAVVGAVATVGGALIGSSASKSAASKQADAATDAAHLQADMAQRQLDFQREAYQKQLELQEPWRAAGVNALNRIEAREFDVPGAFQATTGLPGEFRAQTGLPGEFKATTPMAGEFTGQVNMMADPGYQFRLSEGLKALDRQAAARGGLISGAALKGAQRYGQDYASGEYQNAYNRALTEYQSRVAQSQLGYGREMDAYNAALQRSQLGYGREMDKYRTDLERSQIGYGRELDAYNAAMQRSTAGYNRLASLAGLGQTSVGQLGSAASAYGSNVGNILGQSGAAQAAGITGAANAQAAGTVGMANALTGGISSGINQYYQNQLMNRLFNTSTYGSSPTGSYMGPLSSIGVDYELG